MKNCSILFTIFMIFFLGIICIPNTNAATQTQFWTKMCASCHDGNTAISKEAMREKYQTASLFREAVLNKGGRCMNILKNDKKMIRKVANEIGLK